MLSPPAMLHAWPEEDSMPDVCRWHPDDPNTVQILDRAKFEAVA